MGSRAKPRLQRCARGCSGFGGLASLRGCPRGPQGGARQRSPLAQHKQGARGSAANEQGRHCQDDVGDAEGHADPARALRPVGLLAGFQRDRHNVVHAAALQVRLPLLRGLKATVSGAQLENGHATPSFRGGRGYHGACAYEPARLAPRLGFGGAHSLVTWSHRARPSLVLTPRYLLHCDAVRRGGP
jgi:hypothetical protein